MDTKISIITVNYNDNSGLQKTVNSVLNQSLRNFEFIIIDGNSSDGSKEFLQQNRDHSIRWISEPDRGIYHAMNKGIQMATGKYLLFLNSGDVLFDNEVIKQVDHEIDGTYGIYYCDIIFDEPKQKKKVVFPDTLSFTFFFKQSLSHQATFIKRKLFDEIFLYNEDFKIVSDWEFFIYAICKQNVPYKHLDILTTIYDGNGISSNSENLKMMYQERNISLMKHFPTFISDYTQISELEHKRVKQFFFIKEHPFAWKILKICIKTILFFIQRKKI
ncbi:glycosyltransferase involved in cell wall biosynthesis [Pedobacter cryoconitis]|uniref:Glycosyltransferase involved in cell wall biosynthesis n=1 Tax=Pedobacter cryoconitis TaxID=188932 RepID=A0A7W8ZKF3_9SPHI|nr:glycosyltransferase family 2 protein [Pedobacter cryoconitis]MBB5635651.1 glycosyltransferase involved in cell wall biosynthesis [Pedobacter cryoconitis]